MCYAFKDALFPLPTRDAAWLRGLMSLLALFRILLLSGTWRVMLEDLEGELLRAPGGKSGSEGLGRPYLPYYLCCCLAYERLAKGEGQQVLGRLKALPFDWSRPAFRSFARAVLVDLTRDCALAGRMDDNVQQALQRPLELPGACLPK